MSQTTQWNTYSTENVYLWEEKIESKKGYYKNYTNMYQATSSN